MIITLVLQEKVLPAPYLCGISGGSGGSASRHGLHGMAANGFRGAATSGRLRRGKRDTWSAMPQRTFRKVLEYSPQSTLTASARRCPGGGQPKTTGAETEALPSVDLAVAGNTGLAWGNKLPACVPFVAFFVFRCRTWQDALPCAVPFARSWRKRWFPLQPESLPYSRSSMYIPFATKLQENGLNFATRK